MFAAELTFQLSPRETWLPWTQKPVCGLSHHMVNGDNCSEMCHSTKHSCSQKSSALQKIRKPKIQSRNHPDGWSSILFLFWKGHQEDICAVCSSPGSILYWHTDFGYLTLQFKKLHLLQAYCFLTAHLSGKAHAQLISSLFLRSLSMLPQHLAKCCTPDCGCSGK